MTVELVYDRGCINVAEARGNLSRALAAAGRRKRWTEWVASDPHTPAHVRGFGSPTILIDGRDVAGATAGSQPSCRLYADGGRLHGAPSVDDIASALRHAAKPVRRHLLDGVLGIGVALLPKVTCPACWPAYAALLSTAGLGFLLSSGYLLGLTIVFLTITLLAFAHRARVHGRVGPLALACSAAAAIVLGKFLLDVAAAVYFGVSSLMVASVWNTWPRRRAAGACGCSDQQEKGK